MIAISTAGDDESSPFGRLRHAALALPGIDQNGAHKHARADGFAYHEWSLDPTDDVKDLALLKSANPASWTDEDELRARRDSLSIQDWQLKRFTAGIWTTGEAGAISAKEWAACARPGLEIPAGADGVIIGIDLGWKWDTTAVIPIRRDNLIQVHAPTILTPPQDGTSLDAEEIQGACEMFFDRWPTATFVCDPEAGGEQLAQWLDRELRARVLTHSQKASAMCDASQQLAEAIAGGQIEHPDEALTAQLLAASARFYGVGWRLVKPKRKNLPIDAAVALAMAIRVLNATATPSGREEILGASESIFA